MNRAWLSSNKGANGMEEERANCISMNHLAQAMRRKLVAEQRLAVAQSDPSNGYRDPRRSPSIPFDRSGHGQPGTGAAPYDNRFQWIPSRLLAFKSTGPGNQKRDPDSYHQLGNSC